MIIQYSFNDLMTMDIPPKEYFKSGTKMDEISKGFAKGEIHCICGSTNMGKSLTIVNLLLNFALNGYKTCLVSLENDDKDDIERLKEFIFKFVDTFSEEEYTNLFNNFMYFNASTEQPQEKLNFILDKLNDYEIVLVDGTEFLVTGSTPVEVNANGRKLMEILRTKCREKNACMILSWQTNRLADSKKLEELTAGDLSGSMSVPQQCYTIWILKQWRDKKIFYWKIRMLKGRGKYDFDNTIMNVYDNEKKEFSLTLHMDK